MITDNIAAAGGARMGAKEVASASPVASSDFETFLKMLTVQMQNQDPLNPIESTDYAMQLATFSGVEQQVLTNELIGQLSAQLGVLELSNVADWVGLEGRVSGPFQFDGAPLNLDFEPVTGGSYLMVTDEFGTLVDQIALEGGDGAYAWSGILADGTALPHGAYDFRIEHPNGLEAKGEVRSYSRILEARADQGRAMLVLNGGIEVQADAISALRSPE